VHPLVGHRRLEIIEAVSDDAVVVEDIPLLVETGIAPMFPANRAKEVFLESCHPLAFAVIIATIRFKIRSAACSGPTTASMNVRDKVSIRVRIGWLGLYAR